MILWASLTVAVFGVLPIHTWAEVVDSFQRCPEYFYKGKEPTGFDESAKKICQTLENSGHFYATLYSMDHRMPLYSAYTFDYGINNQEGPRKWHIEPQLSKDEEPDYTNMVHMKTYTARESHNVKVKQAISADYSNAGYDRGHLNQCNDGRTATFTLTNSAPMDACFNRVHWKGWETVVKMILTEQRNNRLLGTAYLVTGAVPASNNRIPKQEIVDESDPQDFNRVTVPTHIWTAVCYIDLMDEEESFSFGYIGANKRHGSIYVKTVPQLTQQLSLLYKSNNLKIFEDNCFFQSSKSQKMVKKVFSTIHLPMSDRLIMSPDVKNTFRTALGHLDDEDTSNSTKKPKITETKIELTYNSVDTWLREMEEIKFVSGFACSLSAPFSGPVISTGHDKLRQKRQTSQELVCRLVPENLDGCTTSCLYNEEAGNYYCSTGSQTKQCSPTYSDVTVTGKKCRKDHTCGLHGYNYYWCYTDDDWSYCSPPLPLGVTKSGKHCRAERNCAYYDESHVWCETEARKREHCCRRADRFTAINGKTCKTDSPCGYQGYDYLWCRTTDDSWDYCCTT